MLQSNGARSYWMRPQTLSTEGPPRSSSSASEAVIGKYAAAIYCRLQPHQHPPSSSRRPPTRCRLIHAICRSETDARLFCSHEHKCAVGNKRTLFASHAAKSELDTDDFMVALLGSSASQRRQPCAPFPCGPCDEENPACGGTTHKDKMKGKRRHQC